MESTVYYLQYKAKVLQDAKAWSKTGGAVHYVYNTSPNGNPILSRVIFNDRIYNVNLGNVNYEDDGISECLWEDD
jgi:hypothetical protein